MVGEVVWGAVLAGVEAADGIDEGAFPLFVLTNDNGDAVFDVNGRAVHD